MRNLIVRIKKKLSKIIIKFRHWYSYEIKLRKAVNNTGFTILASNCMGGFVYNSLKMQFLSPTVNLQMVEKDFQKFCFDIRYYIEQKLTFIESDKSFPVAELGEGDKKITIYFMHYKSSEEAEEKWYLRIKRINYDKLYVIASDIDMSEEEVRKWSQMKCNNLVVFTDKDYEGISYTFKLRRINKYVMDFYNKGCGIRYVEYAFDFAQFLNKH